MHDLSNNSTKYATASIGVVASIFMLMVSAYLNAVFMFRLGKTPLDGYVYASAGIAADVLMALCPFFFFAAFRNKEWFRGFFSLILWVALTAFSAQSAIGHLAGSRNDAASSREVASTSYKDARKDLDEARKTLGFIPQHRPTATVLAEISKHKISPAWIQSNECTQPVGNLRKYCSAYSDLTAELANAMAADKITAKIDDLKAKSETVATANAGVVGDSDAGATTISKILGMTPKDTQSLLNMLGAMVLLLGAGLGPYVSMATVQNMDRKATRRAENAKIIDAEIITGGVLTPVPDAKALPDLQAKAVAALGVLASPRETTPDAKALLVAIGMPTGPCDIRQKDDESVVAYRFVAWMAANGLTGDFSSEQVDQYYAAFSRADNRLPWADRIVKKQLLLLKPSCAWKAIPRGDTGRATVWTIKPPSILRLTEILRRKGIATTPPAPTPELEPTPAPESPKNVYRLFGGNKG